MNPVQYIILNRGLGMSTGKAAAQAAHASVEGVRISAREPNGNPWDASIVNRWYRGGHYAKIVLEVDDGPAIQVARQYIEARGFKTSLIIDEGRTEIEPMSVTALGVEIVDKDQPHVRETFGAFKLYGTYERDAIAASVAVFTAANAERLDQRGPSNGCSGGVCDYMGGMCSFHLDEAQNSAVGEMIVDESGGVLSAMSRWKAWRAKVKENIQNP